MSTDFILPDIGEGIVECEIVEWLVQEGDAIAEDQVVVEVMTDKAVVEIPAKSDGTVGKLYYAKGEIAKVGKPLFAIVEAGSAANDAATAETPSANTAASSAASAPAVASMLAQRVVNLQPHSQRQKVKL